MGLALFVDRSVVCLADYSHYLAVDAARVAAVAVFHHVVFDAVAAAAAVSHHVAFDAVAVAAAVVYRHHHQDAVVAVAVDSISFSHRTET